MDCGYLPQSLRQAQCIPAVNPDVIGIAFFDLAKNISFSDSLPWRDIILDSIEYIAEVLPDGHLSLPTEISDRLNLKTYAKVRISIKKEIAGGKNLKRFCGKWQDSRDAEEIVGDILSNREKNQRSEIVDL